MGNIVCQAMPSLCSGLPKATKPYCRFYPQKTDLSQVRRFGVVGIQNQERLASGVPTHIASIYTSKESKERETSMCHSVTNEEKEIGG